MSYTSQNFDFITVLNQIFTVIRASVAISHMLFQLAYSYETNISTQLILFKVTNYQN